MQRSGFGSILLAAAIFGCSVMAASAESPYEADQRQQLEKYQREHGLSPDAQQSQRWINEWKAEHPGEPVPNAGVLQKLHSRETQANINAGFARMRAQRQAELQREYQLSRRNQEQKLAAQHVTWTAQQWQAWDREYDRAQQQKAQDYLKAVELSGEIDQRQREQEERERLWKQR